MFRTLLQAGVKAGSKAATSLEHEAKQLSVKTPNASASRAAHPHPERPHPETHHPETRVSEHEHDFNPHHNDTHPLHNKPSSGQLASSSTGNPNLVIDNSHRMDWKSQLAKASPAVLGTGVAGVGAYWANQRIGQIGAAVSEVAHDVVDGVSTLGRELPRPGDIEATVQHSLQSAHKLVPSTQTVVGTSLTIGAVLVTVIILYEFVFAA